MNLENDNINKIVCEIRRQSKQKNATWPCILLKDLVLLCDEIDRRFGIGGELVAVRRERDKLLDDVADRDTEIQRLKRWEEVLDRYYELNNCYPGNSYWENEFNKACLKD